MSAQKSLPESPPPRYTESPAQRYHRKFDHVPDGTAHIVVVGNYVEAEGGSEFITAAPNGATIDITQNKFKANNDVLCEAVGLLPKTKALVSLGDSQYSESEKNDFLLGKGRLIVKELVSPKEGLAEGFLSSIWGGHCTGTPQLNGAPPIPPRNPQRAVARSRIGDKSYTSEGPAAAIVSDSSGTTCLDPANGTEKIVIKNSRSSG